MLNKNSNNQSINFQNKINKTLEIYHLFHSGVAVISNKTLLVFDYYNDEPRGVKRTLSNGVISKSDLIAFDKVYVFVSHSHSDHYNSIIFDWINLNKNIKYILSDDITITDNKIDNIEEYVYFVKKDSSLNIDDLEIETFGSTDLGVSFLVNINNRRIFHSGDLNCWYWKSFSKDKQIKEEKDYQREVNKLLGKEIDIAFVPVDPRLEEYYYKAGEYFIKKIRPSLFVPIHFTNNYEICNVFAEKVKIKEVEICLINKRGEKILY
ncbi:MBL fold metallo-hydrolase [Natronospora cellulosivora (SeqCode)]